MGLENSVILVKVLGCRSSLCEGEFIAGKLASMGAKITDDFKEDFNAAVIVTCSVTSEADKKCRQLIHRAKRILGEKGVLSVCGCWAEKISRDSAIEMGIDILSGSKGKIFIPDEIQKMILNREKKFIDLRKPGELNSGIWEELSINFPLMHSRAFVKIQDGCNHFCTYCIIPFLRGKPVSRPEKNILDEVKRLTDNGCKEVILTGIHLGLYGKDIDSTLSNLIRKISRVKNLERLRLGSLEPFSLDENLLKTLSESEIFCPHLHLPLQSGDDEILNLMRRGYTSSEFLKVCDNARKFLGDDLHISSDILVGFPGENDNAFKNTLKIMTLAKFGKVHVFPFSEREGTEAVNFPNKIEKSVKNSRTSEAIELGKKLFIDYASQFLNKDVEVLIEKIGENYSTGHSKNYIDVFCNEKLERNKIIKLKVNNISDAGLKAEINNRN